MPPAWLTSKEKAWASVAIDLACLDRARACLREEGLNMRMGRSLSGR